MSTLQVANIHLESTGNNRIQYAGSNSFNIVSGGAISATVNSSSMAVNGSVTASGLVSANGWNTNYAGIPKLTAFTANGTWSNAYPNLRAVKVTVVGGGGASGRGAAGPAGNPNAPQSPNSTYGGSGGGGGYAVGVYPIAANPALSAPVTVTVGTSGLANITSSPIQPTSGGTSSFGTLITATGGGGGTHAPGSTTSGTNGSGGTGTGGDWNVTGANGFNGGQNDTVSSQGGQPLLTFGGQQNKPNIPTDPSDSTSAAVGFTYGGGGAGARRAAEGANGAVGVVLVEEFY